MPIDSVAEFPELVVGVLVYVPNHAELRLGVSVERVIDPAFLSGFPDRAGGVLGAWAPAPGLVTCLIMICHTMIKTTSVSGLYTL